MMFLKNITKGFFFKYRFKEAKWVILRLGWLLFCEYANLWKLQNDDSRVMWNLSTAELNLCQRCFRIPSCFSFKYFFQYLKTVKDRINNHLRIFLLFETKKSILTALWKCNSFRHLLSTFIISKREREYAIYSSKD